MLHSLKALDGFSIAALDGKLGHVKDIYFDDEKWVVRYLEVDTGGWLTGRRVLISPISVSGIDWSGEAIRVSLSRQQVNDSPGIDTVKPVSRQHEADLSNYYGYPYYWTGPYIWGYTALPSMVPQTPFHDPAQPGWQEDAHGESEGDPHLRSKDEVVGYDIQATDESVGHVDDFLFDEKDWSIPLMVIDTRNWWPGKHVLVSPKRIERVSWEEKSVMVSVTRAQVESSPEYDAHHPPERDLYEEVYQRNAQGIPDTPRHTDTSSKLPR